MDPAPFPPPRQPLVFTPRVLREIWRVLSWHCQFKDNPDAPSEAAFLAHFTRADRASTLSWLDRASGRSFLYDLSINQAQVTPDAGPRAEALVQLNRQLWRVLPPQLLQEPVDWRFRWFEPFTDWDVPKMQFILEQGFDINTLDEHGANALYHAVQPFGGNLDAVKFLVAAGIRLDDVEDIIRVGAESVTGPGEANENLLIADCLRAHAGK